MFTSSLVKYLLTETKESKNRNLKQRKIVHRNFLFYNFHQNNIIFKWKFMGLNISKEKVNYYPIFLNRAMENLRNMTLSYKIEEYFEPNFAS